MRYHQHAPTCSIYQAYQMCPEQTLWYSPVSIEGMFQALLVHFASWQRIARSFWLRYQNFLWHFQLKMCREYFIIKLPILYPVQIIIEDWDECFNFTFSAESLALLSSCWCWCRGTDWLSSFLCIPTVAVTWSNALWRVPYINWRSMGQATLSAYNLGLCFGACFRKT